MEYKDITARDIEAIYEGLLMLLNLYKKVIYSTHCDREMTSERILTPVPEDYEFLRNTVYELLTDKEARDIQANVVGPTCYYLAVLIGDVDHRFSF